MRARDLGEAACGLPTAALADEILWDGEGRVRALICLGGNPVAAWPDHERTWQAMHALDLLVTCDIKMSATAKAAHYVVAPRLTLEMPGSTYVSEIMYHYAVGFGLPVPYAQYTPAIVDPPAGSDLLEEWRLFWGIAQRARACSCNCGPTSHARPTNRGVSTPTLHQRSRSSSRSSTKIRACRWMRSSVTRVAQCSTPSP